MTLWSTNPGERIVGACSLYIKRLSAVDEAVLEELIAESVKYMRETYGAP